MNSETSNPLSNLKNDMINLRQILRQRCDFAGILENNSVCNSLIMSICTKSLISCPRYNSL